MWGRRRGLDLLDTMEMDAFFERLERMNRIQMLSLRAAWQAVSPLQHETAWAAVRAVGDREGLTDAIASVRAEALGWSRRGYDLISYQMNDETTALQIKMDAGEAIVDAALAVALGDRLDDATRDTLLGPWLRATEATTE
jgi:hypothetical protein